MEKWLEKYMERLQEDKNFLDGIISAFDSEDMDKVKEYLNDWKDNIEEEIKFTEKEI